jgi:PIN domain nuclease of toxin-antitoxin system
VRVLLDTHALLWAVAYDELLSPRARHLIQSQRNEIFVSAASAWEIATKYRPGKLPLAQALVDDFVAVIRSAVIYRCPSASSTLFAPAVSRRSTKTPSIA